MSTILKEVELELYGIPLQGLLNENIMATENSIGDIQDSIANDGDEDGSKVAELSRLRQRLTKLKEAQAAMVVVGAESKVYLVVKNLGG